MDCRWNRYDSNFQGISTKINQRRTAKKTPFRSAHFVSYHYCNSTRSLSYIFLISRGSRLLSGFSSDEKALVLKDMRLKRSCRPIEEEVTLVCHRMYNVLQDDEISQDAATDIIDGIRAGCNSVDGKAATRIISSLLYRFMNWRENKASESSLIIEVMRPFIFECIIKPTKDIQFEW